MKEYTPEKLKEILAKHATWFDKGGGERANLQGAYLDFSCLPLWCGGSRFKADAKLVRQLMAHIVTIDIQDADDDLKIAIKAIKIEAVKSHRAKVLNINSFLTK